MENLPKFEFSKNCNRILKGSALSIGITFFLQSIFAILLVCTNMQENIMQPVAIIISAISVLIGSSVSSIKMKKNGLLNGGLVGAIYILTIYVLSGIIEKSFDYSISTLIILVVSILEGMFGGIVGINFT